MARVMIDCPTCDGYGFVIYYRKGGKVEELCRTCKGKGAIPGPFPDKKKG
jgi:DnaJ-class molecular chaperone